MLGMSFALTCRLYCVISDIRMYTDIQQNLKMGANILRKARKRKHLNWGDFGSIFIQIGHHSKYATLIKNEFSNYCQDLRINPAEAYFVVRVLPRNIWIFDGLIVDLVR